MARDQDCFQPSKDPEGDKDGAVMVMERPAPKLVFSLQLHKIQEWAVIVTERMLRVSGPMSYSDCSFIQEVRYTLSGSQDEAPSTEYDSDRALLRVNSSLI